MAESVSYTHLDVYKRQGYKNIIGRTHRELNLTNQAQVTAFFEEEKPDVVVLAAAKVGGINANNTAPAEFAYENMQIQCNVIKCCHCLLYTSRCV